VQVSVAVLVRNGATVVDVIVRRFVIVAMIEIGVAVIVPVGGAVGVHVQMGVFRWLVAHRSGFSGGKAAHLRDDRVRYERELVRCRRQGRGRVDDPSERPQPNADGDERGTQRIEIGRCGEPIGKQDQFIAAYGNVTKFSFNPDDTVTVEPLRLTPESRANLEDNLVLFFTGYTRSASNILKDQDARTKSNDRAMIDNLHRVKALGRQSADALEAGDLRGFAGLMHEHWEVKRRRGEMSNDRIDDWYRLGRKNGALGGKLIGAGGGGFLMFYTEDKTRLRHAMREAGLAEVRTSFDTLGTTVVISS